jgi:hypothetical protein
VKDEALQQLHAQRVGERSEGFDVVEATAAVDHGKEGTLSKHPFQ